jgi:hypothetical protein
MVLLRQDKVEEGAISNFSSRFFFVFEPGDRSNS